MTTRKDFENQYKIICNQIHGHLFKPALESMTRLARFTSYSAFYYRLETLEENYRNLLRYAMEGYHDPERASILNNLFAQMYLLADDIRQSVMLIEFPFHVTQRKVLQSRTGMESGDFSAFFEKLFFERSLHKLMDETVPGYDYGRPAGKHSQSQMDFIFNMIWLSDRMNEPLTTVFRKIFNSPEIEWYEKSVVVSALTVGLLDLFDPQKIILLADIAEIRENQVSQRATTGLILALMKYDERLQYFPEVVDRLMKFSRDDSFVPEVEGIIMQFFKARDTDRITREFEEQVLPEMKKMMPRIEDKLHLNDKSHDEELEGKNPGWKDMIEEVPGLLEKIEKFSRMQMEGGDVFMSTFRQLKRFDFFNRISNWFIPFHREHPAITTTETGFDEITSRLVDSLEKAFYICNSDKYSFALNFSAIPEQQRSMIVANFEAEFAQMKEMASEEQLLDQSLNNNAIFIQYIQDLYRFFKLFPSRNEFEDIFLINPRIPGTWFYSTFFSRPVFTVKIAAYHFEKEHFEEALEAYQDLILIQGPDSEYYEKIGYCHQKTGNFLKAIDAYKRAELFDGDHLWLYKKLGWSYLKIKDYPNAIQYFREAAKIQPDDLTIQLQIGQCLLHQKDYENALNQYQKSRFFAPENLKVLRPLAYCLFILGKNDQADEQYQIISQLATVTSPYDLMNAAHVKLCMGQMQPALKLYKQCFQQFPEIQKELADAFDEDRPNLVRNGVAMELVMLIRDYLLYFSE